MSQSNPRGHRAHVVEASGAHTREVFRLLGKTEQGASRLQDSAAETSERLAELGLWAAMVAHEFNNILTPVLSYSQIALAKPDDRELAAQALERAAAGVEKAVAVAELILDFLRASSGHGAGERAEVGVCLESTLKALGRAPEADGISVVARVPVGLAAQIREAGLGQVFHNLLVNAWRELADDGGGVIEIEGCSTGNSDVEIWFRDTGPGLPLDARRRLEGSWTEAMGGTGMARGNGLGLLVCRKLIEGAGGTIGVEEQEGWGTTFRIVLPAAA
ncbi:MAG: sensor histidine kinase [Phycisphaerales bacterium]